MPDPIHIIFLGTSSFAVPTLEALIADPRFQIDLVVTQPDRHVGRKQALTPPPVKRAALEHHLTIAQPEKINVELMDILKTQQIPQPDFLVTVSYGQLLNQDILDLPKIAPVNIHASLLPLLRGASPIQQAILLHLKETGVTIQSMVRELDAGPILAQRELELTGNETYEGLHDALAHMGAELLVETLTLPLEPRQQNAAEATVCRKLSRADGAVDPRHMAAEDIHRKVRALVPWPGVTLEQHGTLLKLLRTSLVETKDSAPLPCAQSSTLYLEEVQPPGRKVMSGRAWLSGNVQPKTNN